MMDKCHHTQLLLIEIGIPNILLGLALNYDPLENLPLEQLCLQA
jgi:hypothetical protein